MPIETFEQFIKRILTIVFWLLIIAPMILAPVLFIIIESGLIEFPINPYALIAAPDLIMPIQLELMASSFFKVVVFPGFTTAALVATVMILFERKFLAKINLRVGPLYAGKFEGFLQPLPKNSTKFLLHSSAPIIKYVATTLPELQTCPKFYWQGVM